MVWDDKTDFIFISLGPTFVFLLVENDFLFEQFQHDKTNVSAHSCFSFQSSFTSKLSVFLHDLQAENLLILFARILALVSS